MSFVAAAEGKCGGPMHRDWSAAYDEQSFTDATVVVLTSAEHGPPYINDNTVQSDYRPREETPSEWPSLSPCTLEEQGATRARSWCAHVQGLEG